MGKFVEFFGDGLKGLSLADRATISNMAPEYGATCGIFPVDDETLSYLELTARSKHQIELVLRYMKEQGMWEGSLGDTVYTDVLRLDISSVGATLAGPKRPQDKIPLGEVSGSFRELTAKSGKDGVVFDKSERKAGEVRDGEVVKAAKTS